MARKEDFNRKVPLPSGLTTTAKALDATSVYEKHRHQDLAQQRFPDLRKKGSGPNPSPLVSLESKTSKRQWAKAVPANGD
jgi:hypothetical protein